jgi:tellurite resistance protein TerC
MHRAIHVTYRTARRIAIAIIGTTVVLLGIAMLVLPGPGLLTIFLGLMLLGVEFAFARRWLLEIKRRTRPATETVMRKIRRRGGPGAGDGPAPGAPPPTQPQ